MNNKGNLTSVIILIGIIGILLMGVLVFYHIYKKEFSEGQKILNNCILDSKYKTPESNKNIGFVFSNLTCLKTNKKIDAKYQLIAYSNDAIKKNIQNDTKLNFPEDNPYLFINQSINPFILSNELGNNAKICSSINLTYKEINFLSRIFGSLPKKPLENCAPFGGFGGNFTKINF